MTTKVSLRADLRGQSIPDLLTDLFYTAQGVENLEFIYECDVTGNVALKDKEGQLIVLMSIDLDFYEVPSA